jgi:DNA repair ATPase RecN
MKSRIGSSTATVKEPRPGARFYTCALQLNPYAYLKRHAKQTTYPDESAYNAAVVAACQAEGVDVVGVTDHYRITSSSQLIADLTAAGVIVLPGFEAVSKDGVHFLCLFAPGTPEAEIDRCIGDCGIIKDDTDSPSGKFDAEQLLAAANRWGVACIAAHVAAAGGLLRVLSGQSAMRTWKSEHLEACSIAGPVKGMPQSVRAILENTDPQYKRGRPVAVINASDVCDPSDLASRNAKTYIKMSKVGLDGLRQAFLDPESRIRLLSDPEPQEKTEFASVEWTGGFLDGVSIRLNENLNVLVGGPGSGKSTVIESIRYVLGLEPVGAEARNTHEAMVNQVLRPGTKISLRLKSPHPSPRDYVVERTIPNPPIVKSEDEEILPLKPIDLAPRVEVYGQHELSEIARSPEERTRLLHRFIDTGNASAARTDIVRQLPSLRQRIEAARTRREEIEQELAALPALAETLKRYEEAGLEEKLKDKSLLVREEQLLETAEAAIASIETGVRELVALLPIDVAFLEDEAAKELPNSAAMADLRKVLKTLSADVANEAASMEEKIAKAEAGAQAARKKREPAVVRIESEYAQTLRGLQKDNVNAAEFIRLRKRIEALQPLRKELSRVKKDATQASKDRDVLVVQLEEARAAEFRELERAAKSVTRKLAPRVRVTVAYQGNRDRLVASVRKIGGRLTEACATLQQVDNLSLRGLAETCREGTDALVKEYGLLQNQAARIAEAGESVFMDIEELDLPPTTQLELNVAPHGEPASWQPLEALSAGQKATAVLLLLLLESDAPLVVDQPEDDLGSRFITEGVVPRMREEKRRRQFLFSTHNANIPVLGDAELIVGLTAIGEAPHGRATIEEGHRGSIDVRSVCALVEELLEGGTAAFELRRLKYGIGTHSNA